MTRSVDPDELLRACADAAARGADFPTIWTTLLRPSPIVLGLPSHRVVDGEAQIVIELIGRRRVISSVRGFSLE